MDWRLVATVLPTCISASCYTLVGTTHFWSAVRRRTLAPPAELPFVSILKPVAGAEDELLENLESFAVLAYPNFELLLGIASRDDTAIPILERFLHQNPTVRGRIVFTTPPSGNMRNPKVAQLIDLTRAASGSVLVVSDANVRVPRTYLASVLGVLYRPNIGLVSR